MAALMSSGTQTRFELNLCTIIVLKALIENAACKRLLANDPPSKQYSWTGWVAKNEFPSSSCQTLVEAISATIMQPTYRALRQSYHLAKFLQQVVNGPRNRTTRGLWTNHGVFTHTLQARVRHLISYQRRPGT